MGHYQSWKSSPKYSFTQKSLNLEILAVYRAHRPHLHLSRQYAGRLSFPPNSSENEVSISCKATNFLKTFYSRKL